MEWSAFTGGEPDIIYGEDCRAAANGNMEVFAASACEEKRPSYQVCGGLEEERVGGVAVLVEEAEVFGS